MRFGSGGWEMVGQGQSDVMKLSIKLTNQGLGQGKGGRKREFSKLPASLVLIKNKYMFARQVYPFFLGVGGGKYSFCQAYKYIHTHTHIYIYIVDFFWLPLFFKFFPGMIYIYIYFSIMKNIRKLGNCPISGRVYIITE